MNEVQKWTKTKPIETTGSTRTTTTPSQNILNKNKGPSGPPSDHCQLKIILTKIKTTATTISALFHLTLFVVLFSPNIRDSPAWVESYLQTYYHVSRIIINTWKNRTYLTLSGTLYLFSGCTDICITSVLIIHSEKVIKNNYKNVFEISIFGCQWQQQNKKQYQNDKKSSLLKVDFHSSFLHRERERERTGTNSWIWLVNKPVLFRSFLSARKLNQIQLSGENGIYKSNKRIISGLTNHILLFVPVRSVPVPADGPLVIWQKLVNILNWQF